MLGREVEIGFDAGEGDADGIGRRETEVELEEFRERVAFEIAVVNTDKGRTVDFIEIVAPCVSGVLISRERGAEVDSDSEDVDIGFIFFLRSVEADTHTLSVAHGRKSVAVISVFVKNFVFVHKFTSKIVRIIAFERL